MTEDETERLLAALESEPVLGDGLTELQEKTEEALVYFLEGLDDLGVEYEVDAESSVTSIKFYT